MNPRALVLLARVHIARDETEVGLRELERVRAAANEDTPALREATALLTEMHFAEGRRLFRAGDIGEALAELMVANELTPAHWECLRYVAHVTELRGDREEAAGLYRKLADRPETDWGWRAELNALQADSSPESQIRAAALLADHGEVRAAEARLRQSGLKKKSPLPPGLSRRLADATQVRQCCDEAWGLVRAKDLIGAKLLFKDALELSNCDQEALRGMGFVAQAQAADAHGRAKAELSSEAQDYLIRAIEIDPTTEEAQFARNKLGQV